MNLLASDDRMKVRRNGFIRLIRALPTQTSIFKIGFNISFLCIWLSRFCISVRFEKTGVIFTLDWGITNTTNIVLRYQCLFSRFPFRISGLRFSISVILGFHSSIFGFGFVDLHFCPQVHFPDIGSQVTIYGFRISISGFDFRVSVFYFVFLFFFSLLLFMDFGLQT